MCYTEGKELFGGRAEPKGVFMQYIVLDMEWNQAWPGSYAAERMKDNPIHGEIIQIGAVRVSENREVCDEFEMLIRPKFFRKLTGKVRSLTGLRDSVLRQQGVDFPDAIEAFLRWCGKDFVLLTWGFDDVRILKENLAIHHLPAEWTEPWFNAQLIFNAQTDGSSGQKALSTAMEMMQIPPSRPAHDALGDAYHTALICAGLDLALGIARYGKTLEKHENGFHGAELPDCIDRRVMHGYDSRSAALEAMTNEENLCPTCKGKMKARRWISQQGHRYMAKMTCPQCGDFLVRVRLQNEEDGKVRVGRLVYSAQSEAAKAYDERAQRRPARHRRGKKADSDG